MDAVTQLTLDAVIVETLAPLRDELRGALDEGRGVTITRQIFDRLCVPNVEVSNPCSGQADRCAPFSLRPEVLLVEQLLAATLSNAVGHRAGNYLRWHSNIDDPGVRTYCIYNAVAGSIFRYLGTQGRRVDCVEPAGWSMRRFTVTADAPFWHCVYAEGERITFGFRHDAGSSVF